MRDGDGSIWGLIPLFVLKIHLGINSGPDNIQYLGFNLNNPITTPRPSFSIEKNTRGTLGAAAVKRPD